MTVRHRVLFALAGALALAVVPVSGPVFSAPAPASPKPAQQPAKPAKPGDELAAAQAASAAHTADGVAAIVNDTVISTYDLRQRVALFVATNGAQLSDQQIREIRSQVLKQLESERLQLLEAQKNDITVSAEEVDKAIANIESDNNLKPDQLKMLLERAGVAMETLRGQIAAQIAWAKAVQGQYGDRVHVSKEEVDAEMARISAGKDKPHFMVSEIFESVDSPEQDAKVLKDMQDLVTQLHAGARFATVARQFSQNPTAAQGGDLGMVQEGQVPKEIYAELLKMRSGEVSDPIRSVGGYYILGLRQRLEGVATGNETPQPKVDPNPTSLPLARILLPIGPKPSKELLQNAVQAAQVLRTHITSCAMVAEVPKQVRGAQVYNLGTMKLSDLSEPMQQTIKAAPPGGVTAPIQSAAGIELIVRCDKAIVQDAHFKLPTKEDVENQLFEDKMGVFSRQYMRDLRRNADVEDKV